MTMTDVDRLLREYIEQFESGGAVDPSDLLAQAEGTDREKLSTLIEGYLENAAPAQEWDPAEFEGSLAEQAAARVAESWSEAAGGLPVALVRLRNQRRITRADLVIRLSESLGVGPARERVAFYYHQLERGLLPAERISGRVWDSLAQLLGTTADSLRKLGARAGPVSDVAAEALYARTAPPPPAEYADRAEPAGAAPPGHAEAEELDEVDRLFTGG
jgi:hypothetical protein